LKSAASTDFATSAFAQISFFVPQRASSRESEIAAA